MKRRMGEKLKSFVAMKMMFRVGSVTLLVRRGMHEKVVVTPVTYGTGSVV